YPCRVSRRLHTGSTSAAAVARDLAAPGRPGVGVADFHFIGTSVADQRPHSPGPQAPAQRHGPVHGGLRNTCFLPGQAVADAVTRARRRYASPDRHQYAPEATHGTVP